jgi:HK97 gp10 family phage protein
MNSGITVQLQGVDELKRVLAQIPDRLKRKGLLKALRLAAKVVRDAARQAAPVLQQPTPYRKKGTVRRAIVIRPSKAARRSGDIGVFVGVRPLRGARTRTLGASGPKNPNDPFYWSYLEFGTKKMSKRPFLAVGATKLPQAAEIFIREATAAVVQLNNQKAP